MLTKHVSAIVEPDQVGDLMRVIDGCHSHSATRVALLLSALLFQRPSNIRQMEWAELDLEGRMWVMPFAKMKRTKRENTGRVALRRLGFDNETMLPMDSGRWPVP